MYSRFVLPLVAVGCLAVAVRLPAQESSATSGTLKIADQEYKLTHAVAFESLQFGEKQLNILLSIKPIDKAKLKASLEKDGTDDKYFTFDPQVKVKFDDKGKASFTFAYGDGTSVNIGGGTRLTGEAAVKDGKLTGQAKLALDPEDKGRFKSQFEIKFSEPLLAAKLPAGKPDDDKPESDEPAPPKTAKTKSPKAKKAKSDDDDVPAPETVEEAEALAKKLLAEALGDYDDAPKAKKGKTSGKPADVLNVKDLPLPKDASDIAYKKLVEQLTFKTEGDVETTAETFAEGLKKQGWEESGADLVNGQSAVLRRKRGKAELTIFVKPDGDGAKVTMMTSGLSWDEKK
jgi:hypothetical protein